MLLKDLFTILVSGEAEPDELGTDFRAMLDLAETMFREVNVGIWGGEKLSDELRKATYQRDVKLNKLERSIRKRALSRLAASETRADIPYCYVLINVVKDAERIGDYVKNLAEVELISTLDLPPGEIRDAVRDIGRRAEVLLGRVGTVFDESLRSDAEDLVRKGRALAKEADQILPRIAHSGYDSSTTTSLVLMTRFYKRIIGHTNNILSSVIMPLHKIDYFDEEELG